MDGATLGNQNAPDLGRETFTPEKARLPIANDLAAELAGFIGHRVCVETPGYKGHNQTQGILNGLLKSPSGDIILKLDVDNSWSNDKGRIPSIHLIPWSKVFEFSTAK